MLHNNLLSKIEGLEELKNLVTLNLSHNQISKIENLGGCTSLNSLEMSHNRLLNIAALEGLRECPSITVLDVSNNYIEYEDGMLDFMTSFKQMTTCYYKGNPAMRKIS